MKFWVSKNSEIPVRDQLVAQIMLGIASGDLASGERLPSTRELARRFQIHQNTVSSAYRELTEKGLVDLKKGSGVFVANGKATASGSIATLFDDFLEKAASAGHSKKDVHDHLRTALETEPAETFLVVESDTALREILIEEIRSATGSQVDGIAFEEFSARVLKKGEQVVALFDEQEKLRPLLPAGASCIFLNANSIPNSLSGAKRPSDDQMIAIVSGWEKFVSFARLFLLAAKIDPEMFIPRLTSEGDWKKGIDQASIVVCDSLAAKQFTGDARVRVFCLIAPDSVDRLCRSAANI